MLKISISGIEGSGKSTIGKMLSRYYKIGYFSVGKFRRDMAEMMGMSLDELNKVGEKEPWTDKIADYFQKKLNSVSGGFVFDGRLSWHFIPKSIKIFFVVDETLMAKRISGDNRKSEKRKNSVSEIIKYTKKRRESDIKRYKKIYGIENYLDAKNYDIVIDTSGLEIKDVFKKTVREIRKYRIRKFFSL